ncbi:MAG: primosomal protein N' [Candidatus Omnitrophota bacterium]|jgi:primosomal protein N' (replication factor Y)
MYAQVVFNLPIEGPFDYFIPAAAKQKLSPGMRVGVSFGKRRCVGYVVGKRGSTQAKKVKPILSILDDLPILDKTMLKITRQVADYYACSWGQAIETATPVSLRKSKPIGLNRQVSIEEKLPNEKNDMLLLQDISGDKCWEVYLQAISDTLKKGKTVILLVPDRQSAEMMQKRLKHQLSQDVGLLHSYLSAKKELAEWIELKCARLRIVVGTRLAIFAPMVNLGLIIIEQEQSQVYKQDSAPHYNAVGVAKIRAKIEGLKLILASHSPTIESWYQAKKGKIKYILRNTELPAREIKVIDLGRVGFIPDRRKIRLSISLEDAIMRSLEQKGKVLLFLNRRGFSIFAYCHNCGMVLRCPRCNANLILHFKNSRLICHSCNYNTESPRICPNCNSGYIRYSGLGTEKLESELHRLYPQFKIARLDKDEQIVPGDAQIIVSTESIFKHPLTGLDLIGVIWPDTVLNRPDFRAAEKIFALLLGLGSLTTNALVIQTNYPEHYCFQALVQRKIDFFYETELKFRRQSNLPPFRHVIIVSLRARKKERASNAVQELFNILKNTNQDKSITIDSFSPQIPHKKRDKFYEQILLKAKSVPKAVSFLKKALADFRRSGIIITVDVDPV